MCWRTPTTCLRQSTWELGWKGPPDNYRIYLRINWGLSVINTVKHNEGTRKTRVFLFWWMAQVAQRQKKAPILTIVVLNWSIWFILNALWLKNATNERRSSAATLSSTLGKKWLWKMAENSKINIGTLRYDDVRCLRSKYNIRQNWYS